MKIYYYKDAEDAINHDETIEEVDWVDGFATKHNNKIVFKRSYTGEEVSIDFTKFITVVK